MKILFINPNTGNKHTKPPLGLLSVGTVCKEAGHEVSILDAALLELSAEVVGKPAHRFDIVGITAMSPFIKEAMRIAIAFGKDMPVIIGGVHATLFPEHLYLTGLFDSVIVGEGEDIILKVLADLEGGNLKPIYKGQVADILVPDYGLIDINAYRPRHPHAKRYPWTSVQTSRGCPFSCSFCTNIFGHKYRAMGPEQVYAMLDLLCTKYGVKDITFYDDEFTMDRKRIIDLCGLLIKQPLDLEWTCESRVDLVDGELLKTMRRAGCRLIYYGIESGNQGILKGLNKTITLSKVVEAVKLTKDAGIMAAGYFMLGCPGETEATMEQTVNFAHNLGLGHAQFSVCSPLPGSRLYELYGNGKDWDNYQYLGGKDKVYCSGTVSPFDIEAMVEKANASYK